MPPWLRSISYVLPMTYAAEAMRSILGRGEYTVWCRGELNKGRYVFWHYLVLPL